MDEGVDDHVEEEEEEVQSSAAEHSYHSCAAAQTVSKPETGKLRAAEDLQKKLEERVSTLKKRHFKSLCEIPPDCLSPPFFLFPSYAGLSLHFFSNVDRTPASMKSFATQAALHSSRRQKAGAVWIRVFHTGWNSTRNHFWIFCIYSRQQPAENTSGWQPQTYVRLEKRRRPKQRKAEPTAGRTCRHSRRYHLQTHLHRKPYTSIHRWLGWIWDATGGAEASLKRRTMTASAHFATLAGLRLANAVPLPLALCLFESKIEGSLAPGRWLYAVLAPNAQELLNELYFRWARVLLGVPPWKPGHLVLVWN